MIRSPMLHDGQQQQRQKSVSGSCDASPLVRMLPSASAATADSNMHAESGSIAAVSSTVDAGSSSNSTYSSGTGVSVSVIGMKMLEQLEAECEQAARGARQRAEEFAKFIDEQIAELEDLATESARLQAEVEDLNAKTQQNVQEVEVLLEEDKAVDLELARVAAAKERVDLRFQSAQRKLQAARSEYGVVFRQDLHARREWRSRVDLYKFTHGLRLYHPPGQSTTRICFLGLYKELPQLECYLDVSLEADSCRVVGAWPEAPLSELAALYAEGRVSFAALLAHSRLLFKFQLSKMSHTQKLVSLHEQQRQQAAEEKQLTMQKRLQERERDALLLDA